MLDISSTNRIHIGHLDILLSTGTNGAPAALPADLPSWRQLHEDEDTADNGWSS